MEWVSAIYDTIVKGIIELEVRSGVCLERGDRLKRNTERGRPSKEGMKKQGLDNPGLQ